jgi:hypothetical protein
MLARFTLGIVAKFVQNTQQKTHSTNGYKSRPITGWNGEKQNKRLNLNSTNLCQDHSISPGVSNLMPPRQSRGGIK